MPLPTTTAPLPRVWLNDAAYGRIRDWILDGTLAPGEALRDEALAEALGMSRTPIRDALHRLDESVLGGSEGGAGAAQALRIEGAARAGAGALAPRAN